MTTISLTAGPFRLIGVGGAVQLESVKGETGLRLSPLTVTAPITDTQTQAWGIRFRNGTTDSIPDQKIVCGRLGFLTLPEPLGTTTRGLKAQAPDGSIWYLQVQSAAPA